MSETTHTQPSIQLGDDTIPPAVNFTDNAAKRVYDLMCESENLDLKLRVYIEGGGCSGFKYGFKFEEDIQTDDTVIEKQLDAEGAPRVTLLVDPLSYQYLAGADIDFKDDLEGERFIIRNPQAATTCGCGSSFTMKEEGAKEN